MEEVKEEKVKKEKVVKEKKNIVLKNTRGEEMKEQDYFFSKEGKDTAHKDFNKICGMPVEREELVELFDKIFNPEDNFLFYKAQDKEVYIIIVPLKYSNIIGEFNDSQEGEFQKHAMSFISEGSTNVDNMKTKLLKVKSTIKIVD